MGGWRNGLRNALKTRRLLLTLRVRISCLLPIINKSQEETLGFYAVKNKMEFEMLRVNDLDDLEIITPEPFPGIEGFFYFPLDRCLAVNRNSEILNIKTGKILPSKINKSNGGHYVYLSTPGSKTKAYFSHRVVALTFIGRPSRHLNKEHSRLDVNHVDGDRNNNDIGNLEWVTGKENCLHARDSGLKKDNFKILVKCIVSGVITISISGDQCAKDHKISKHTLHKHLKSGNTLKFHKDGYLFRYQSDGEWPKNHPDEIKEFHIGNELGNNTRRFGVIAIHDLVTGNRFISDTITNITNALKLSYNSLARKLSKSDYFVLGNYQFKVVSRN